MGNFQRVLVLGATGYVGGRLVDKLLQLGYLVTATSRSKEKLLSRSWASHEHVTCRAVDVNDEQSLKEALVGQEVVYYLVHGMNPQNKDFEESDRECARNLVRLAESGGIKRIIYLGGLGEDNPQLSKHLRSRHEVAEILQQGKVPVTVFRAAMIIGSGSASFEILRYLVERLPIMVTPKWVKTPNQPIAIRNVIEYLTLCLEKPQTIGKTFDIGGKDVLSYLELMRIYAEVAGLPKRWIIPVPVLTPRLSSLWIHLVTPVPSYIARPLAEGLSNPVICHNEEIKKIIPLDLLGCRQAIQRALISLQSDDVKSYWADAGKLNNMALIQPGDASWAGGTLLEDKREIVIQTNHQHVWRIIVRIGGKTGWYHGSWLWGLRGIIDRLMGGVGTGRGRRSAIQLAVGDVVDFWRVLEIKQGSLLVLAAEMKLPGEALLIFRIKSLSDNACELTQHAMFRPKGLGGICYWYAIMPLHAYIFGGMINKIKRLAEQMS